MEQAETDSHFINQHTLLNHPVFRNRALYVNIATPSDEKYKRIKYKYRKYIAEFIGTFTLMVLGLGVNTQLTTVHSNLDGFAIQWFIWGLAVMCAMYLSGGISVSFPNNG
jgi:hypothetical protein